jgi:AcrR family transcriptional regulator
MTPAAAGSQAKRPRRRGRPRSAGIEANVFAAVQTRIISDGFAGLTIDRIARTAGVPKSTIYRRWGTLPALLATAIEAYYQRDFAEPPDTGSLAGDLAAHFARWARQLVSEGHADLWIEIARGMALDPATRSGLIASIDARRQWIGIMLRRGQARGELPADADFARIAEQLWGPFYMRMTLRLPIDEQFARDVVDFVLKGAGARTAAPR